MLDKTLHKHIVTLVLILLYFFQVNIAQRTGMEFRYFNYLLLLLWSMYLCLYRLKFREHKYEYYIILTAFAVLITRYYWGMFEETMQTLFNAIFPALLIMIVSNGKDSTIQAYIKKIIIIFFITNSCFAIIEFLTRTHLIGWVDVTYSEGLITFDPSSDFRAVALAGSPLSNALLTTILNIYILFSDIKIKYKYVLYGLGVVAILAFNARTAIIVNVIAFTFYYIKDFKNLSTKQKRFSLSAIFFLLGCILFLVFNTNMGSRLFSTESIEDDGSIAVRLKLFEKMGEQDFNQFLWGSTLSDVRFLMEDFGVLIIENFWICYILHLGIVVLGVFTYLYFKLACKILGKYGRYESIAITLCFILLASSNNSLYSTYIPLFTFLLGGYIFRPIK